MSRDYRRDHKERVRHDETEFNTYERRRRDDREYESRHGDNGREYGQKYERDRDRADKIRDRERERERGHDRV